MMLWMRDQENIERGIEQGLKQGIEQGIKQGMKRKEAGQTGRHEAAAPRHYSENDRSGTFR